MTKPTIRQSAVALAATAAVAIPTGTTLASHTPATSKAKTYKYSGPSVDMRWGPVKALIHVRNKKIVWAKAVTSPDTMRSQFIDDESAPLLKQETLDAQNANIDIISGATMTIEAYIQSLQAVVKKAQKHKTLK